MKNIKYLLYFLAALLGIFIIHAIYVAFIVYVVVLKYIAIAVIIAGAVALYNRKVSKNID